MSNQIPSVGFYTPTKTEEFNASVFSQYMNQNETTVLDWALNVTQKAYDKGIVPSYIERSKTQDLLDDKDYIDFWASISIIFGYIVELTRKIGLENPDQEILFKYLEQRNLFNSPTETLQVLEYVMENYYDQIRKRGTFKIIEKSVDANGELLRILSYRQDKKDEFNFNYQNPSETGWVVNSSSPLYCNAGWQTLANKAYQLENQALDLTKYPKVGTPVLEFISGIQTIQLNSGDAIGGTNLNFEIPINPSVPYQVSFLVRGSGSISFGIIPFNLGGSQVSAVDCQTLANQNNFFTGWAIPITTEWYQVVGIIYPYTFLNIPADISKTNVGIGQNLKSIRAIRSIIPQITCTAGTVNIYGLSVSVCDTGWQTSFIHPANFINVTCVNRNGKLSNFDVASLVRYYMLPYDCVLATKFVENLDEPEQSVSIDLNDVLLNKTNQGIISGSNLLLYTT